MKNKPELGILGLGHTGLVYATCFAKLGFKVICYDLDSKVINNLSKGNLPYFEPGLKELFLEVFQKGLFFSKNPKEVLKNKDYIFITEDLFFSGGKISLERFNELIQLTKKYPAAFKTLIISSQIPVGTSRKISRMLQNTKKDIKVIYFLENLKYGEAISRFLNPEIVFIGKEEKTNISEFKKDFAFWQRQFYFVKIEEAELLKQALNYYTALNISFSSEMSDICQRLGCDYQILLKALRLDKRISPFAPINLGLGFSGVSLKRDLYTLVDLSLKNNYQPELIKAILKINSGRLKFLIKKIEEILPNLRNKKIGIMGLTFRPKTDVLKESISLNLAQILYKKGSLVRAFDPTVKNTITNYPFLEISQTEKDFFKELDLVALLTPWQEFETINPQIPAKLMKQKKILDCFGFFDEKKYRSLGFEFYIMGKGEIK